MEIVVRSHGPHGAVLEGAGTTRRAAIGAGGIGAKRAEGDGITPAGRFAPRRALYRADRLVLPKTRLPIAAVAPDDAWCDDPSDPAYNHPVKLPHRGTCERLWREDHLYDLVVIIGFNDAPVIAGAGSAIFLHVARPDYGPTRGCIALALTDLLDVVALLQRGDTISLKP